MQHRHREELYLRYRNGEVKFWDATDRGRYSLDRGGFDAAGLEEDAAEVLRASQTKLRELDTGEPLPLVSL
jgi:hypothetical protein